MSREDPIYVNCPHWLWDNPHRDFGISPRQMAEHILDLVASSPKFKTVIESLCDQDEEYQIKQRDLADEMIQKVLSKTPNET